MNIIDSFYFLFRSDASGARKDIAALEKQIDSLKAKGKQRSDEETKNLKEAQKQHKVLTDQLKEQKKAADEVGDSFTGFAEKASAAAAAYVSLNAIRSGFFNAATFNSRLQVQSNLLGQNVKDIAAYGAAVEQVGGTVEGFQGTLKNLTLAAAQQGVKLPPLAELFERFHKTLAPLSQNESLRVGGLLGLDEGSILLLRSKNYEELIKKGKELTDRTNEDTQAARDFEAQWDQTAQSLQKSFSKIGSVALPVLSDVLKAVKGINELFTSGHIQNIPTELVDSFKNGQRITPEKKAQFQEWIKNKKAGSSSSLTGWQKESYDFWISQGYTPQQAAGWVANEQAESGGKTGAVGDSGASKGSFQWKADRRRRILEGTGIDVTSASHADQLRAAAWEAQITGVASRVKNTSDAGSAASLISRIFENPANGNYEAIARAQAALGIASNLPISSASSFTGANFGGDKNTSFKTGDINIHTAATDANGIADNISSALLGQFRITTSNFDDGIAY